MNLDRNYILDLAQEILTIPSPSGYHGPIIERIKKEALTYDLPVEENKKGNLILTLEGTSDYTVGLSVHVDTLGAMVRSIDSEGNLRFTTIGGPSWPTMDGEYCTILTREGKTYTGTFLSTSPAVHVYKDANSKTRDPENMLVRIDEVVKNKDDVKALGIEVGNYIFFDPKTTITPSGYIKSRFLDDKINVASIFGLIKALKDHKQTPAVTIKFIISTYEEVGHGAAHVPKLDEMIAIDMGCIGDDLSCTEHDVSICVKDSSGPYDYELTKRFADLAKKHALDYALDVYPYYGSDVSAARRAGHDFKGALIGPGVHASHGMERTHVHAVEQTIALLYHYVLEGPKA